MSFSAPSTRFLPGLTGLWLLALAASSCAPTPAERAAAHGTDASPMPARQKLSVAAAADLKYALDEVVARFHETRPDIEVQTTYGASGSLYAQLTNKAPFDLFFSADIEYPRKLIAQGLADPASEFQYAEGTIVIWVRNESRLQLEAQGIESLLDASVRKIAIANPEHAPYGRAAVAALNSLGVYERIQDRLVFGENVAQAAQFVESGAADVGILALSLALAPALKDKGRHWKIPASAFPKMEQGGVTLNWAKNKEAATAFREFMRGDEGRALLEKYGFGTRG